MAAKFRKIDPRIWHDEGFSTLSTQDRLIAIYCLSSSQTNRIGIFHVSAGLAAEQLGMEIEGYRKGMARVCDTLKWHFDKGVNVLYLPKWWKYNGNCGPKTMKGLLEDIHDVPKTPLLQQFASNREFLSKAESEILDTLAIPMPYPSAFGAQEQEQEQEKEQEKEEGKPRTKRKTFKPPTIYEVRDYCIQRKNNVDPQRFIDHYTSNGWMVGKNKMKDWKAAVRTWERNEFSKGSSDDNPDYPLLSDDH